MLLKSFGLAGGLFRVSIMRCEKKYLYFSTGKNVDYYDVSDFRSLARFKNGVLATDFTPHLKCFSSLFYFIVHMLAILCVLFAGI